MKNSGFTFVLRTSLVLSLALFLILAHKQAEAFKLWDYRYLEKGKIRKPNLAKGKLKDRMNWLATFIPERIPEITKHLKKDKTKIALVVYKKERQMELWLREPNYKKLKTYKMYGFSGKSGPKNKQGDFQIPEGLYRASILNPNSAYYLSVGINYPNKNDRKRGKEKNISDVGGDIFIHGRDKTIGCVPIGDHWIEEIFYIVGTVGLTNTQVLIAPSRLPLPKIEDLGLNANNSLIKEKYSQLTAELTRFD